MSDKNAHYQDFPEDWKLLITKIRDDKAVPKMITDSNIIPAIREAVGIRLVYGGTQNTQGDFLYNKVRSKFKTYGDLIEAIKSQEH